MWKLKLYVWEWVLESYTSWVMFALAENVEEAKKVILEKEDFDTIREDLEKGYREITVPEWFIQWWGD